jgi:hypothetical protein
MDFLDAIGDYDEDAGEVIDQQAKDALRLAVLRGYALRMASRTPVEVPPLDAAGLVAPPAAQEVEWDGLDAEINLEADNVGRHGQVPSGKARATRGYSQA